MAAEPTAFDPETTEQLNAALDAINDTFADAFAFVARAEGADDGIETAVLTRVHPTGVDAEVTSGDGTQTVRLDFEEPVAGLDDLGRAMLGLITRARELRPSEPLTSFEQRLDQADRQVTSHVGVVAVNDLSPDLLALTIGPMEHWTDLGGDQAVSLLIELPGRPIPERVRLAELRELGDDVRPKMATYSIRRHDPDGRTVEVWVARHSDDQSTIAGWAGAAEVGSAVTIWGPRRATIPPADVSRFVGVCDETGVAATVAMAEELPAGVPVDLVVEVRDDRSQFALTDRPGVVVHWRHRGDAPPGTGTNLVDATRSLVPAAVDGLFVFGAAEARCISGVRRYLRRELDVAADRVSLTGYWRDRAAD
ncbi:MAG: siderophore-interacting protein [Actinomycetota bacterium]